MMLYNIMYGCEYYQINSININSYSIHTFKFYHQFSNFVWQWRKGCSIASCGVILSLGLSARHLSRKSRKLCSSLGSAACPHFLSMFIRSRQAVTVTCIFCILCSLVTLSTQVHRKLQSSSKCLSRNTDLASILLLNLPLVSCICFSISLLLLPVNRNWLVYSSKREHPIAHTSIPYTSLGFIWVPRMIYGARQYLATSSSALWLYSSTEKEVPKSTSLRLSTTTLSLGAEPMSMRVRNIKLSGLISACTTLLSLSQWEISIMPVAQRRMSARVGCFLCPKVRRSVASSSQAMHRWPASSNMLCTLMMRLSLCFSCMRDRILYSRYPEAWVSSFLRSILMAQVALSWWVSTALTTLPNTPFPSFSTTLNLPLLMVVPRMGMQQPVSSVFTYVDAVDCSDWGCGAEVGTAGASYGYSSANMSMSLSQFYIWFYLGGLCFFYLLRLPYPLSQSSLLLYFLDGTIFVLLSVCFYLGSMYWSIIREFYYQYSTKIKVHDQFMSSLCVFQVEQ